MKNIFAMQRSFNTRDNYINKYYYAHIATFAVLNALLFYFLSPGLETVLLYLPGLLLFVSPKFGVICLSFLYFLAVTLFNSGWQTLPWGAVLMAGAIPATLIVSTFLHNAAHKNFFKSGLVSRITGELCALFQLVGFPDWHIVHNIHHRHSDDVENDPHPTEGLTFWQFLNSFKTTIGQVLAKNYFERHGETARTKRLWTQLSYLLPVNQLLKAVFWFLVFGPVGFTYFYVATIVSKNLLYADFNFSTHAWNGDAVEIKNLDHNLFYRVVNRTCFGLYFHKNHHIQPNLFDPRKLEPSDADTQFPYRQAAE